jgi:hypothetical protein
MFFKYFFNRYSYLWNTFSQDIFVVFFIDTFAIIIWFEHSFNLFNNSLLSLDFFQKLKIKLNLDMKRQKCFLIIYTFSLTAISTAEVGTSSIILSLSSITLIWILLLDLPNLPTNKIQIIITRRMLRYAPRFHGKLL